MYVAYSVSTSFAFSRGCSLCRLRISSLVCSLSVALLRLVSLVFQRATTPTSPLSGGAQRRCCPPTCRATANCTLCMLARTRMGAYKTNRQRNVWTTTHEGGRSVSLGGVAVAHSMQRCERTAPNNRLDYETNLHSREQLGVHAHTNTTNTHALTSTDRANRLSLAQPWQQAVSDARRPAAVIATSDQLLPPGAPWRATPASPVPGSVVTASRMARPAVSEPRSPAQRNQSNHAASRRKRPRPFGFGRADTHGNTKRSRETRTLSSASH